MTRTTPNYTMIAAQEAEYLVEEEYYDHVESGNVGIPEEKKEDIPQKQKQIISTAFALFTIAVVGVFANNNDNTSTTDYSISSRHLVECPVDVKMACEGCEPKLPDVDYSCAQAPNMLGMLFRGGSCEENDFTQPIKPLTCVDENGGPPNLGSNQLAFIRALNETNNEIVFQGMVREGDIYNIVNSNGGALGSKLAIDIFADSTQQTPLQSVTFEVSCSDEPSILINVFGASQIAMFANDVQGTVSPFATVQVPDMTINIELSSTRKFTLQELSVRTNLEHSYVEFPVAGSVINTFEPLQISFELPFNAGVLTVDNIVRGVGVTEGGVTCMFTSFKSFPVFV